MQIRRTMPHASAAPRRPVQRLRPCRGRPRSRPATSRRSPAANRETNTKGSKCRTGWPIRIARPPRQDCKTATVERPSARNRDPRAGPRCPINNVANTNVIRTPGYRLNCNCTPPASVGNWVNGKRPSTSGPATRPRTPAIIEAGTKQRSAQGSFARSSCAAISRIEMSAKSMSMFSIDACYWPTRTSAVRDAVGQSRTRRRVPSSDELPPSTDGASCSVGQPPLSWLKYHWMNCVMPCSATLDSGPGTYRVDCRPRWFISHNFQSCSLVNRHTSATRCGS